MRHEPCDKPTVPAAASLPSARAESRWLACSEGLPECMIEEGGAGHDATPGEAIPRVIYSQRVLVTVDDAGLPFVSTDRLAKLDGCDETWWERFGQRVTHWMPLPPPA